MQFLPYGPRRYRCVKCGHEFTTSTNHDGQIYNFPCPRKDQVCPAGRFFGDGGPEFPGVYEYAGEVQNELAKGEGTER